MKFGRFDQSKFTRLLHIKCSRWNFETFSRPKHHDIFLDQIHKIFFGHPSSFKNAGNISAFSGISGIFGIRIPEIWVIPPSKMPEIPKMPECHVGWTTWLFWNYGIFGIFRGLGFWIFRGPEVRKFQKAIIPCCMDHMAFLELWHFWNPILDFSRPEDPKIPKCHNSMLDGPHGISGIMAFLEFDPGFFAARRSENSKMP